MIYFNLSVAPHDMKKYVLPQESDFRVHSMCLSHWQWVNFCFICESRRNIIDIGTQWKWQMIGCSLETKVCFRAEELILNFTGVAKYRT